MSKRWDKHIRFSWSFKSNKVELMFIFKFIPPKNKIKSSDILLTYIAWRKHKPSFLLSSNIRKWERDKKNVIISLTRMPEWVSCWMGGGIKSFIFCQKVWQHTHTSTHPHTHTHTRFHFSAINPNNILFFPFVFDFMNTFGIYKTILVQ